MSDTLGVAVIGAGMAGKAHAAAYRMASAVYDPILPPIRLVSIGDVNAEFGSAAARRFGYERHDSDWRAIAAADDIQVVSVVIANHLHRDVVEGLLAAGKHVLCEKPLSDTLENARAMAKAAREASTVARIGFSYRRSPGIAFIRELVQSGELGDVLHFSGRYWTDYASSPQFPMSWRFKGGPGTGALADVGSHLSYVAEFICGEAKSVNGGRLATSITERPVPLGAVQGHGDAAVSDEMSAVENDDYATFSAEFANGVGSFEVSRVAAGHPNSLILEVFCSRGAARWSQERPSQVEIMLTEGSNTTNGYRTVHLGPQHPYIAGGLPMDASGVGFGQNELFLHQARAFLEEVAGVPESESLPRCASFDEGVHNMEFLDAVVQSAQSGGSAVLVPEVAR